MFSFTIKCVGDQIEIEVWLGKQRLVRQELPMRDMRDRAAIEAAFSGAENIFRKEVLELIQIRTQLP